MATLETQQFNFEPDMKIITEQCDQAIKRNPAMAKKVKAAIDNFKAARKYMEHGNIGQAFEKLREIIVDILDLGLDELEASCSCYIGFIGLGVGSEEPEMVKVGIDMMNNALHKTQNPWLALNVFNRLTIHYLDNEGYDMVMKLADSTENVVSKLPGSKAGAYFISAANYSRAETCYRQERYKEVLPYISAAKKGFDGLSMKQETAKSRGLLGNALIFAGEIDRGLIEIEYSLKFFQGLKNEHELAFLLQGRGLAMYKKGNTREAIRDLREALRINRKFGEANAVNATLAALSNIEVQ